MADSKLKPVWLGVKLVILVVLLVVGWKFWQRYQRDQEQVRALHAAQSLVGRGECDQAATAYEAYWRKYPTRATEDRDRLANCFGAKAHAVYEQALSSNKQAYPEAAALFERGRQCGALDPVSLEELTDCYLELKKYAEVRSILAEAKQRPDVDYNRFKLAEKRLEKAK